MAWDTTTTVLCTTRRVPLRGRPTSTLSCQKKIRAARFATRLARECASVRATLPRRMHSTDVPVGPFQLFNETPYSLNVTNSNQSAVGLFKRLPVTSPLPPTLLHHHPPRVNSASGELPQRTASASSSTSPTLTSLSRTTARMVSSRCATATGSSRRCLVNNPFFLLFSCTLSQLPLTLPLLSPQCRTFLWTRGNGQLADHHWPPNAAYLHGFAESAQSPRLQCHLRRLALLTSCYVARLCSALPLSLSLHCRN